MTPWAVNVHCRVPQLAERRCPQNPKRLAIECTELHHTGGASNRSLWSVLLRDAEVLDFPGVVGVWLDSSSSLRKKVT
jgi:hypothetical protein